MKYKESWGKTRIEVCHVENSKANPHFYYTYINIGSEFSVNIHANSQKKPNLCK